MGIREKITPKNLNVQQYFIRTNNRQNPYLLITGLDDVVGSGVYSFIIHGSSFLLQDSEVRFEAIDSRGNQISIAGVRNILKGNSRVVSFTIDDTIEDGEATIYVAAVLEDYLTDQGLVESVPQQFSGDENLLFTFRFDIDKEKNNNDEIIFKRPPVAVVTPKIKKVRTITKPDVSETVTEAEIVRTFYNPNRRELQVTVFDETGTKFEREMDGKEVTITNADIDLPGTKIFTAGRKNTALFRIPNPDVSKYTGNELISLLPDTIDEEENAKLSFTIDYNRLAQYNLVKLQEAAFATFDFRNLTTVSGDVEKIRIYGKSDTLQTDYNLINEYELLGQNSLVLEDIGNIGIFDNDDKLSNWNVSTVTTSSVLTPTIARDESILSAGVVINGVYNFPEKKEVNGRELQTPRYKFQSDTNLILRRDTEYFIRFKAAVLEVPEPDTRLDVYIVSDYLSGENNSIGKLIGSIRTNSNDVWEDGVEMILTNESDIIDGKIAFVNTAGRWILSDIEISSELQKGFSPAEYKVDVPVDVKKDKQDIDFRVEFLDADDNKASIGLQIDNVIFDRPNLVIEGFDNFLSGSLFVGEATSSGIGLGLSDAGGAFIKSVPYDGFIDATTGGQSGFLLYSGSVTSSVEDEYSGSLGVEIVKDEDNYLRFRTQPSLFEVKSDVFFFGNADTQFISGSNSNIEISASNFHLDPKNNLLIIRGAIRQDSNGVELTDFRNRGTWSAGIIYLNNDLVQYDSASLTQTYIAVNDHTSSVSDPNGPPEPDTSNNWELFAAAGQDGEAGQSGSVGAGVVFRGTWETGSLYFASTTRRDVVVYDDGGGDDYYLATSTHTASISNAPDGGSSAWETFGAEFSSVATDILFAQDVYANRTINIGSDDGNPVIALNADSGSYENPSIRISSTGYDTNGIFLGFDEGKAKVSLKSVTNSLLWDGTNLTVNGGGTFTGQVAAGTNVVLGDNVDGGGNDGIYLGSNNYWYDGGTFEVGNGTEGVTWNGSSLNITGNIINGATAFQTGTGFFADDSGNFYVGENGEGISLNSSTNEVTIYDYEFSTIFTQPGQPNSYVLFNNVSTPLVNTDEDPNRAAFMHVTRYNDSSSTLRTGFLLQSFGEGSGGNTDITPIALTPHKRNDLLNNSTAWYFDKQLRFLIANNGAGYIGWETEGDHRITGDLTVNNDVDVTGTVDASLLRSTGDVIAFYSSDENLKDNIIPIKDATQKIKQIGGYEFDWNDKQNIYEGHDVGVLAQEVEKVLPEIVQTRESGYKAVKYEKLVPLLIESIKELSERVEELENKLSES